MTATNDIFCHLIWETCWQIWDFVFANYHIQFYLYYTIQYTLKIITCLTEFELVVCATTSLLKAAVCLLSQQSLWSSQMQEKRETEREGER